MSKRLKIWLIVAASLMGIGVLIFGGAMTAMKWDFKKLSAVQHVTNEYAVEEEYGNISVLTESADVVFLPSADGKTSVVCYEQEKVLHTVSVRDGTLTIHAEDTRRWYEYLSMSFSSASVTVYLPQGEYGTLTVSSRTGDVKIPESYRFERIDIEESTGNVICEASASDAIKIKTSTGRIQLNAVSAGSLDLSVTTGGIRVSDVTCAEDLQIRVTTGKTRLNNVRCKSLTSAGSTGDITMKDVIASERISVERSTGDVELEDCDGGELFFKTDTGDVEGTLRSEKIFHARTDTGEVEVPRSTSGGLCEIITHTGDIEMEISSAGSRN